MESPDAPERAAGAPPTQYLAPEHVLREMAEFGYHRIVACIVPQVLVLGALGGMFVAAGATDVAVNKPPLGADPLASTTPER